MKFGTVYPSGWFNRTPRAKQHAFLIADEAAFAAMRRHYTTALCGAYGSASGREFTATEGNSITCGRCAREVKRRKDAEASHAAAIEEADRREAAIAAGACERCAEAPATTHQEYDQYNEGRPTHTTNRCDRCAQALRDYAALPSIGMTIQIDRPIEATDTEGNG